MLTVTLRSLERDGLVSRTVRPTTPPEVEYGLTDLGQSIAAADRCARPLGGGETAIALQLARAAFESA